MKLPSVDEIVEIYSQSKASDIGQSEQRLFQQYGLENLIPLLVVAYRQIPRSNGRSAILFWLTRYARTHPSVVALATSAVVDRSYLVREHACSILAYSLSPDVLPYLSALQSHKDAKTRADASAAIDAIACNNHHYYIDRQHTGGTLWGVNHGDAPGL